MSDLPERFRAFIAVRIPDSVRAQLAEVQQQLKRELRDVSWTRPDAMHLTLQFLGDVGSARLLELERALRQATQNFAPFEMALGEPDSFGNRVIWIGIERGAVALKQLSEAIRTATQPFAEHEEAREFNAHVTLGRLRRPARGISIALQKVTPPKFSPWIVNDFELIRSELSSHGSHYTTLANIALRSDSRPR